MKATCEEKLRYFINANLRFAVEIDDLRAALAEIEAVSDDQHAVVIAKAALAKVEE